MFDAASEKLARIRRISRIINALCGLAMVAILCGLPFLWIGFNFLFGEDSAFVFDQYGALPDPMPGPSLLAGFVISLLPAGLMVFGFDRLRRLFGLYAQGVIFSAENSRCLRAFALSVIGLALLDPLIDALLSVALTSGNPSGSKKLVMSFGSAELSMIFVGMIFLVIARIMELGNELAEEQSKIV